MRFGFRGGYLKGKSGRCLPWAEPFAALLKAEVQLYCSSRARGEPKGVFSIGGHG